MDEVYMITTSDNPYSPFDKYDEWAAYDRNKGYYTAEYLARVCQLDEDLSEEELQERINKAIDEILEFNVLGIYQKVTKKDFEETKEQEQQLVES